MPADHQFQTLFEPIQVGPVVAPNRFYSVPHSTGHGHLQPNGSIGHREMKAEGGWGVVAMSITEIAPDSDLANHPMEKLWDDSDIPAHARLVERIHHHGSLAAVELGHGGMRARNFTTGLPVIGPSVGSIIAPEIPVSAKAMTKNDIKVFRKSHRMAARRAKKAGYDIIYAYAAHNISLLFNFLEPIYNKRFDEYGGSLENRVRLLREVLEDMHEEVGDKCAVALRFSVHDFSSDSILKYNGQGRDVVELLSNIPDLWDVNVSGWSRDSSASRFDPEGFQENFVKFVKGVTHKPVVGVGRFTSPETMVSQIKRGILDFIGAARPSIADPFLPKKIQEGQIDSIRECIGCNVCVASDSYGIPLRCTQNPTVSEEWRRNWHPEKTPLATDSRSILVIGGGPSGLECALTLARAGHKVTVTEKSSEWGGRVAFESKLAGLKTWYRVIDYRLLQLKKMQNVSLFLESNMDLEEILSFGADYIYLASGSYWRRDGVGSVRRSEIPGFANTTVLTPDDFVSKKILRNSVTIYDDDHNYMASTLAEQLAKDCKTVNLVSTLPSIATWTQYTLEQQRIKDRLLELGINLFTNIKFESWNGHEIHLSDSDTGKPVKPLESEHLVSVTSRKSNNSLKERLHKDPKTRNIFSSIGDAVTPGTIQMAVLSGHQNARKYLEGKKEIFRREVPKIYI